MGLDKIISTQEQVGGLQEQLTAMEPVLIKTQAEVEGMIVTIIQDKEEAGKTQKTVRKRSSRRYIEDHRCQTTMKLDGIEAALTSRLRVGLMRPRSDPLRFELLEDCTKHHHHRRIVSSQQHNDSLRPDPILLTLVACHASFEENFC